MTEPCENEHHEENPSNRGEQYLDLIAASAELVRSYRDVPPANREVIIDIRARMALLGHVTGHTEKDLKMRFGCRQKVEDLPRCELEDLQVSSGFLGFVVDVVLLSEDRVRSLSDALDLAVTGFKQLRTVQPELAVQNPRRLLVPAVIDALREGNLTLARKAVEDETESLRDTTPLRTSDGRLVFLDRRVVSGLATQVMNGSFAEHLGMIDTEDDQKLK